MFDALEDGLTFILEPPAGVAEFHFNNWFALPAGDPATEYTVARLWDRPERPVAWQAARLSKAVYLYREQATRWAVVVKFYSAKTGPTAESYAQREFQSTWQARELGLGEGALRAVAPRACWGGALFLEYIDGVTLEDAIAIRRSQPGMLLACLDRAAQLLAALHARGIQQDVAPSFQPAVDQVYNYTGQLSGGGVLEREPLVRDTLLQAVTRWQADPVMEMFTPTAVHGDATSSNFIFPWGGGLVAIDWERFHVGDPAADLGRLMAEVWHSIQRHGGHLTEAAPLLQHLAGAYLQALPTGWDGAAFVKRARFHQASSTLRIARNGWLSRGDRATLVAQALALLL